MKVLKAPNLFLLIKIIICIIWSVLFILLLKRDFFINRIDLKESLALSQDAREEYQGIYFQKQRIGFVKNTYSPSNDSILVEQQAQMHINVLKSVHPVFLELKATLSPDNQLRNFTLDFKSPFYNMTARGRATGNRIDFTMDTGSNTITDSLKLTAPPMLPTSRRGYLLHNEIQIGNKVKIPWFDPLTLTAKDSTIEYKGKEKVLIQNRVHFLHHFVELSSGMRINSWLNDEGDVIKEESPAGFVFLKEPEFKARAISTSSAELLSAVSVKVKGKMVSVKGKSSMKYRLTFPESSDFVLNNDRQKLKDNILTITLEKLPGSVSTGSFSCSDSAESLRHSPYIQSNHPDIIALSNRLIHKKTDNIKKVRGLADWVFTNIKKRPVLGIPDALTTLNNKTGDCNEHAALFAALARAAEIPTRIAAGVVYHKDGFYYHAWNEVCLGNQWVSIDTTTNQFPADLSHIKFIQGEIQEQVKIGMLLGRLAIEPMPDQPTMFTPVEGTEKNE